VSERSQGLLNLSSGDRNYPVVSLSCRQNPVCYHEEMVAACEVNVEQKTDEVGVVVLTQAIVHPRTVVI
jgi:hypothetical protein